MDLLYGFYQENDYGIRESLLEEGHRLLQDGELRSLAATVLLRILIDAILARGYARAYGYAADYLIELRALSSGIADFRGQPSHEAYQRQLATAHARKASFRKRVDRAVDCAFHATIS